MRLVKDVLAVVKKSRWVDWLLVAIVVAFFLTRLYALTRLPMFNDEAIYIHWSEVFRDNHHQFFVSLTDGKQPSFIWLVTGMLGIVRDPLMAGRLVSVAAGLTSLAGMFFLTRELFKSNRTAFLAMFLYLIFPYCLLYDRMALYDSMLFSAAIWSLYFEVLTIRHESYRWAVIAAIVVGAGMLTKSGAYFFILLLPFTLLLLDFGSKATKRKVINWLPRAMVIAAGAYGLYSLQRFSPSYKNIALKNAEFTLTVPQWLEHPFAGFYHNLGILLGFLVGYATIPLLALALASLAFKQHRREKLLLVVWFVAPFFAFALFAKLLYPRYILFMTMPLIPLAATVLARLTERVKSSLIVVLVMLMLTGPMLYKDYFIITNFSKAPVPELDKYAYIQGYYSGVGVKQIADILNQKSQKEKIYVATQGTFGIMPYSLQNYLHGNENIIIEAFGGIGPTPPSQVLAALEQHPTYHVFTAPCPTCQYIGVPPATWHTKEIFKLKRIEPDSYISLVEVLP